MARTARLALEVDARGAKRGASEADRELKNVKRSARETTDELRKMAKGSEEVGRSGSRGARGMRELSRETDRANQGFLRARVSASGLSGSLVALRNAAGVLIALQLGRYFLDVTDRAKRMDGQLRLSVAGLSSFAVAQDNVRRIAQETRSGLEVTGELYGKFARNAVESGRSSEQAAKATETFAKALKISNTGVAEGAQVTRQFGQALASGVLRGDEFNSVMENAPRLARLLAQSLGTNTGALREMAEQGQLTADKLYTALTDVRFTAALDEEFRTLPVTFGEAMQLIKDSGLTVFSAFDRGGQFSNMIVDFVLGGQSGFKDMEASAENFGIEVRTMLASLAGAWAPFRDFGLSVFSELRGAAGTLGNAIAGLFGGRTSGNGLSLQDFFGKVDWASGKIADQFNTNRWSPTRPLGLRARGTTLLPDSVRAGQDTERDLRLDQLDRRIRDTLPGSMQWNSAVGMRRWLETGSSLERSPPMRPPTPKTPGGGRGGRTANAEVGRDWTAAEVAALARREGFRVIGVDRTAAQQQAQIDLWLAQERRRPGSGGPRPAAVGTSAHEKGLGVDFGREHSVASIKQFAQKHGIPIAQLLNEGDHKHLGIRGAGGRGGKTDAQREADKLEQQAKRRQEMEREFFETLKEQADVAGMLPLEAERYNAQAKLRDIINKDNLGTEKELTAEQVKQIDNELARKRDAEFRAANMEQQLGQEADLRRIETERAVLSSSTLENEEANLRVAMAGLKVKEEALAQGKSLTDETVVAAIREAEARERTNATLEEKNNLIRRGRELTRDLLDRADPEAALRREYGRDRGAVLADTGFSPAEKDRALKKLADDFAEAMNERRREFFDEVRDNIRQVGDGLKDAFGEAFGVAVEAALTIATILQQQAEGMGAEAGARSSGGIARALSGLSGLAGTLAKEFGRNGQLNKTLAGISKALGQAAGGAAMGAEVATLAKALGFKKFSTTGSQIGGAIGSFLPIPGGEIIGSIIGGTIGGLLKKTKKGSATITSVDDPATISGNSRKFEQAAGGLAESVQGGLARIAEIFGAELGSFAVSIGVRHGDFRVDPTGRGKTKKSSGAIDFNEDEGAAIAFAILDAIRDGAIKGLSPTVEKIIRGATTDTLEKAVADAAKIQAVSKELAFRKDPVKAALEELNKQFTEIDRLLDKYGGTLQEYADAEELYQLKRKEIIEQGNNAALRSMRDYLFQLQGGTASVLSPEMRLMNARAELDRLDAERAAGGNVDFGQYQTVADAFLAASRDAQGSTLGFFADLGRVTNTIQQWITQQQEQAANVPVIDISPVVQSLDDQSDILRDIRDGIWGGAGGWGHVTVGETRHYAGH